ncbi:MAG: sporulation transcriptional regulator SpoIIID [Candidatus Merdivicinus sp.]
MTENIEERSILFATYIIDTHATVRATAKKFDYSKSTVHIDVTK